MDQDEGFLLRKRELGARQSIVDIYTLSMGLTSCFIPTKLLRPFYFLDELEYNFISNPKAQLPVIQTAVSVSKTPAPLTLLRNTLLSEILVQILEQVQDTEIYHLIRNYRNLDDIHFITLIWKILCIQGTYPDFITMNMDYIQGKYYDYRHHLYRKQATDHCFDTEDMTLLIQGIHGEIHASKKLLQLTLNFLEQNLATYKPITTLNFLNTINL